MTCELRHPGFPDAGESACCWGAALDGASGCTCWVAEYDQEQATPDLTAEVVTRSTMCAGCAFRPGTQAWRRFAAERDDLVGVDRFWCHDGTRRVVRFRHPSGVTVEHSDVEPDSASWEPPAVGDVYFRADGSPADLCAGWAARRRALSARAPAPPTQPLHPQYATQETP